MARCKPGPFDQAALAELSSEDLRAAHTIANSTHCLHYYLCKSPISEDEAYRRSQDPSLNEQVQDEAQWISNLWRMGDDFHIDSCSKRHVNCYPHHFATPSSHIGLTIKGFPSVQDVQLSDVLGLNLLQTCSQIYLEAKTIPLTQNTFGFSHPSDLTCFLFLLNRQSSLLRSIWLTWFLNDKHMSRGLDFWEIWLAEAAVASRLSGLRVLHLSLSISQDATTYVVGPSLQELQQHGLPQLSKSFEHLRKLSLEKVTVILSEQRNSKFGDLGCPLWDNLEQEAADEWLALRQHTCLRASEKRALAEGLRRYLLKIEPGEDADASSP